MLVNITARAGSIEDNKLGGWYGYRMAKCALNMANRSLMHELGRGKNKVTCLLLNPGKGTSQPGLRLLHSGNFFLALNRSHHFLIKKKVRI